MSEHRENRQQLKRKQLESALSTGISISAAAKEVGVSYQYAKLVKAQMEPPQ